jgi:nucleoside-diphosphate-sugar epimerase
MKIMVLGGAGYVGRVLCDFLYYNEHELTVFDRFLFSKPSDLVSVGRMKVGDTRELTADDFRDVDVVFDLAALSNDPAGELNPALTREINAEARVRAAHLARRMGVQRYVLFSSCSVYGANDDLVDETTPPNPLTAYAVSNLDAERGVTELADESFCVTIFRLATVFGISPSMRFDLVVNTMTLDLFNTGCVTVTGGGQQYRPFVHVADVAKAACQFLDTPTTTVNGEIFNIAYANMQLKNLAAEVIKAANRPVELIIDDSTLDQRNYRVTNDKALADFGFQATRSIPDGVRLVLDALETGRLVPSPNCVRLNGYRSMLARDVR